jgi:hypothetical protein
VAIKSSVQKHGGNKLKTLNAVINSRTPESRERIREMARKLVQETGQKIDHDKQETSSGNENKETSQSFMAIVRFNRTTEER